MQLFRLRTFNFRKRILSVLFLRTFLHEVVLMYLYFVPAYFLACTTCAAYHCVFCVHLFARHTQGPSLSTLRWLETGAE